MANVNKTIHKAVDILNTMCHDKQARADYLSREMALHDEATRMEEAMTEGYEKGEVIGKSELLIKQLTKKFKHLPEEYENKIKGLSVDVLEELAMDIFELEKVDDLKKYF